MASKSRLQVILGTMEFGRRKLLEEPPCFALMDAFTGRGYKELDTALMYTDGKSEEIIGKYPNKSNVSIATKANPWGGEGLKKERVLEQARLSLERLQVSCVDIFYLHAPDHKTPIEETLSACQQLYEEGKFKELGLSNYAAWEVADVYHICKRNGWVLPTVYQGMYNAIARMVENELFPALRYFGLRFYAYNPLAGGMLTDRYQMSDLNSEQEVEGRFWSTGNWSKLYRQRYWRESVFSGVAVVREALDGAYGRGTASISSAAIRWLNHHSMMAPEYGDGIILGASNSEHLLQNMDACEDGPLDQSVVDAFQKAWTMDKVNCANYYR